MEKSGYDENFIYTLAGQRIGFSLKGSSAKKALRAFAMFSSIDLHGLRSCCHHTPRHLAVACVLMDWPATSMVRSASGLFEKVTASVLLEFSVRKL